MLRLINEHEVRKVKSLDGCWDFVTSEVTMNGDHLPSCYPRKIWTPSAWECIPGMENYRGKAWLKREFELAESGNVRLVFGGVSHTASVYVDSELVGEHYDAYTPWEVLLPGLSPGRHELIVEVDNSFGGGHNQAC